MTFLPKHASYVSVRAELVCALMERVQTSGSGKTKLPITQDREGSCSVAQLEAEEVERHPASPRGSSL